MARKYLRDLLVEDQEPFLLDAYIFDRRRQLNKPPGPLAHPKSSSFGENLLRNANACFSSFSSSSPFRRDGSKQSSSLPPGSSAAATRVGAKTAGNNTVLLHVPTRTAALLLEAALRIESYGLKGCDPTDRKKQGKSGEVPGAGESLFRKFVRFGRRSRKKEFRGCEGDDGVLVREILGFDKHGHQQKQGKTNMNGSSIASKKKASGCAAKGPCSTNETLEAHMHESEQIRGREPYGCSKGSDLGRSPFRYPTPELPSPTMASPICSMVYQDKANEEESDPHGIQPEEEEEVEKEQSSPVSVLDPHSCHEVDIREHGYTNDNDGHEYESEYEYEYKNADHSVDYEASYTRTKRQLLQKLYVFERLAGLDHVELEERSIGQDDGEDEGDDRDVSDESSWGMGVTRGMMKRVSDIVLGEQQEVKKQGDRVRVAGTAIQGYYRRNGMVRREEEEDHLEDAIEEIEDSILGLLVEELSEELCLHWCL